MSDYPKVTLDQLETAPEGLYQIDEPPQVRRFFDVVIYSTLIGRSVRIARVDDRKDLPEGVDSAWFRSDGKRVVVAVTVEDPTATFEENGVSLAPPLK